MYSSYRWRSALGALIGLVVLGAATAAQGRRPKIMIFGGENHKTYLGCLSCPQSEWDSIFNKYGEYGHCAGPFDDNLFCRGPFKEFGTSGPFKNQSACGTSASDPPVIVDEEGRYYGRFSVGGTFAHSDAVCSTSPFGRFRNSDACKVVEWVCQQ